MVLVDTQVGMCMAERKEGRYYSHVPVCRTV
jgi:hypothetical protein